jgi:hypothetical protein
MRTNKNLNKLKFQQQEHTEWCWAAVATMIAHFYDAATALKQCDVAISTLENRTCCAQSLPAKCNVPAELEPALRAVNRFVPPSVGPLGQDGLMDKTDAETPVCARIGYSGGGGHFVAIKGYDNRRNGNLFLLISDPEKGERIVLFTEFRDHYRGKGTWTDSYFTG